MDSVQLYISCLNKVHMLTSLTSFVHEMTSINSKNFIAGYLFSITHLFDKFKENFWIFYSFGKICTIQLHISWLNQEVVMKSSGGVDFAFVAILDIQKKFYNYDILIFMNRR